MEKILEDAVSSVLMTKELVEDPNREGRCEVARSNGEDEQVIRSVYSIYTFLHLFYNPIVILVFFRGTYRYCSFFIVIVMKGFLEEQVYGLSTDL
jgi:hypothetical protein